MRGFPGARGALLPAVLVVLPAACGGQGRSAAPAPTPTRPVLKIATQSPLSGDRAVLGVAIRNGVQLAVEQRADRIAALGFDGKGIPFDDRARRGGGLAHAGEILAGPDVLLVIGPLTSTGALRGSAG